MSYATPAQLTTLGLLPTALGNVTAAQIQGALDTASSEIDGYFKGRPYALPLVSWGIEVTRWCCVIAAWELMSVRGFNPASGADPVLRMRRDDAISTLREVQRKAYHPDVTEASTPGAVAGRIQPTVRTSSVTTSTGMVATNRGW